MPRQARRHCLTTAMMIVCPTTQSAYEGSLLVIRIANSMSKRRPHATLP